MRLWPLALIRKLRARPVSGRILPLDPREQQLLDRQREQRRAEASQKKGTPSAPKNERVG